MRRGTSTSARQIEHCSLRRLRMRKIRFTWIAVIGVSAVALNGRATAGDGVTTFHAVVCGVSEYQMVNDLRYGDDDATDFRQALLASGGWSETNVKLLTNNAATKQAIRSAIREMAEAADDDDVCIFFFSGHGTTASDLPPYDESDGYDEYICPSDTNPYQIGTLISDDELGNWMAALATPRHVVILDTCFSGGQIKGLATAKGLGDLLSQKGDGFAADLTQRASVKDLDDNNRGVVITACDDDETSVETGALQNGAFTYWLLQGMTGLADKNRNGWVSAEELYAYLLTTSIAADYDQHAQMYDGYGKGEIDFIQADPDAWASPPQAHGASATASTGSPLELILRADDDGLPEPPAALTFVVITMPSHGTLSDPATGVIAGVPHVVGGGLSKLTYTSDEGYLGKDVFTFRATDGGQAPHGGDSNTATVVITVVDLRPPAPSPIQPLDGASGVGLDATLEWLTTSEDGPGNDDNHEDGPFTIVAGTGSLNSHPFSLLELQTDPAVAQPLVNGHYYPAMDCDPAGRLYVASSSLYVLDLAAGSATEIGRIHSRSRSDILVHSIAFAPDGTLYGMDSDYLLIIDPATAFAREVGQPDAIVWGIDFAPDGTLYAAFFDLVVLDPSTGAVIREVGRLSSGSLVLDIDFAPDGSIYGVNDEEGGLYRINPATAESERVATYDEDLWGVASVSSAKDLRPGRMDALKSMSEADRNAGFDAEAVLTARLTQLRGEAAAHRVGRRTHGGQVVSASPDSLDGTAVRASSAATATDSPAACPTVYDVYLSTNNSSPLPVCANLPQPQCNPGSLRPDTTYSWWVVARNCYGESSSSVWSFTTGSDPMPTGSDATIPLPTPPVGCGAGAMMSLWATICGIGLLRGQTRRGC
jgi:uncharacterized caspase-like protein